MKVSTELFDLIKSMSRNEKRYFKLGGIQDGSTNYLLLFRVIDEQVVYNEAEIKEKFKEEKFVQQLHVTKNQLYNLVLKSLRTFHEKKSIDHKLNNLLLEATLLKERGLYAQSEKHLKKAKKLAEKYEKHLILLAIRKREVENILHFRGKELEKEVHQVFDQADESLHLINREYKCLRLQYGMMALYKKGIRFSQTDFDKQLNSLAQHPYLDSLPEKACTFRTEYSHLHAKSLYALMLGDILKTNYLLRQIVKLWESYPHYIKAFRRNYKVYLINYLQSCHVVANYNDFPNYLDKLKKLPSASVFEEVETFRNVSSLELLYYMNTMQYSKAIKLLPKIKKDLQKYDLQIDNAQVITLRYNIMVLLFATENYNESLDWLYEITEAPKTEVRSDLYRSCLIFQLVIQYELGNYQILEYLLASVYKKLNRGKKYRPYEKSMIKTLQKLIATTSKNQKNILLTEIKERLERIKEKYPQIFGLEEMIIWAQSRLEGKKFMEILGKVNSRNIN